MEKDFKNDVNAGQLNGFTTVKACIIDTDWIYPNKIGRRFDPYKPAKPDFFNSAVINLPKNVEYFRDYTNSLGRTITILAPAFDKDDIKIYTVDGKILKVKLDQHQALATVPIITYLTTGGDYSFDIVGFEVSSVDISNGVITIKLDKLEQNKNYVDYSDGYRKTTDKEQTESK